MLPVDDSSDLVVGVEVAVVPVLPRAGHHVVPFEIELERAVGVRQYPELVHERAAADVVPVGVDVDLQGGKVVSRFQSIIVACCAKKKSYIFNSKL